MIRYSQDDILSLVNRGKRAAADQVVDCDLVREMAQALEFQRALLMELVQIPLDVMATTLRVMEMAVELRQEGPGAPPPEVSLDAVLHPVETIARAMEALLLGQGNPDWERQLVLGSDPDVTPGN